MTAADLVRDLQERGVTLVAAGNTLRFRPKSVLTESDLAALKAMKAEVLVALQRPAPSLPSGPLTCYCCRRRRFWISTSGRAICATCHPPPAADLIASWIETAQR